MLCRVILSHQMKQSQPSQNEANQNSTSDQTDSTFELLYKSYISGILSGLLGIGGGLIINPLLLEMGHSPLVASALSAFVVLFTSASTSTQFLILGAFDLKNAVFVAFLSTTGSIIGCLVLKAVLRKFKRPSVLIWLLLILLIGSTLLLPIVSVQKMDIGNNLLTFNTPC